jgi:hypothetical protein
MLSRLLRRLFLQMLVALRGQPVNAGVRKTAHEQQRRRLERNRQMVDPVSIQPELR